MMTKNRIAEKILKYDLCLGCGMCSSVFGKDLCEMRLTDKGFYRPEFKGKVEGQLLKKLCPGIRVHGQSDDSLWGNVIEVVEGWSSDAVLRHKAASGGVVSALAIYTLESGLADAVLQVGVKKDSYLYNELKVSRSKDDVINNAQSRYAPALTLVNIKQLLDSSTERFAFVGKPCDIAGVKNLIEQFPAYRERFSLFISIFCAGMPSYKATETAWKESGYQDDPSTLKYRGDGWPGMFRAAWSDGRKFELSYNDSWGKILGRQLGYRCKICPDSIGMLADIAVGDSWNTNDGYPDFTEDEGRCFVFVRTERGKRSLELAKKKGFVEYRSLSVDRIQEMQKYQHERRKVVGWRLLPVWLFTKGLINFKGIGIIRQTIRADFSKGLSNMKGSFSRMLKIAWHK